MSEQASARQGLRVAGVYCKLGENCPLDFPHGEAAHFAECRKWYERCLVMTGQKVASIRPSAEGDWEVRPRKDLMGTYTVDFENCVRWALPNRWEIERTRQTARPNPNPERALHRRLFELHVVQGIEMALAGKLVNLKGNDYRMLFELNVVRGVPLLKAVPQLSVSAGGAERLWREVQELGGAELEQSRLYPPAVYFG